MNRLDMIDEYLTMQRLLDDLVDKAMRGEASWMQDVDQRTRLRARMDALKARWLIQSEDDETDFYREIKRREAARVGVEIEERSK